MQKTSKEDVQSKRRRTLRWSECYAYFDKPYASVACVHHERLVGVWLGVVVILWTVDRLKRLLSVFAESGVIIIHGASELMLSIRTTNANESSKNELYFEQWMQK